MLARADAENDRTPALLAMEPASLPPHVSTAAAGRHTGMQRLFQHPVPAGVQHSLRPALLRPALLWPVFPLTGAADQRHKCCV